MTEAADRDAIYRYATEGIRGLLLLNGGGAIAVLTFLGSLLGSDSTDAQIRAVNLAQQLVWPIGLLAFGAILAPAVAGLSYAAQLLYVRGEGNAGWWIGACVVGIVSGLLFLGAILWTVILFGAQG